MPKLPPGKLSDAEFTKVTGPRKGEPAEGFDYAEFFAVILLTLSAFVGIATFLGRVLKLPREYRLSGQIKLARKKPLQTVVWFVFWSALLSFFEWWFHGWILHTITIWISKIFRPKHLGHHGRTEVGNRESVEVPGTSVEFTAHHIETRPQEVHRKFPWYALAGFMIFFSVRFLALPALIGLLVPALRASLLPGMAAVVSYYTCYELIHAWYHEDIKKWQWAFNLPLIGKKVHQMYVDHEEHHDEAKSNLNLVWDLGDRLFGTKGQRTEPREHGRRILLESFPPITPNRLGRLYVRFETSVTGLFSSPLSKKK